MIIVAIVEDDATCAKQIASYIRRYEKQSDEVFDIRIFGDGSQFLNNFQPIYDIVFMDIDMPNIGGLETAKFLREADELVCIIFVTNMAQYAIRGYEVDAMDFMIKPVAYADLEYRLAKATSYVKSIDRCCEITLCYKNEFSRIRTSDILYVEVNGYLLDYHILSGDGGGVIVKNAVGTLAEAEKRLPHSLFVRCNKGVLVNLLHVSQLRGSEIVVGGDVLPLSRAKKKEFVDSMTSFHGGF